MSRPKQTGQPKAGFAGTGARAHGTRATILEEEVRAEREKYLSMPLERKRRVYRSGEDRYLTLADVDTWPQYHRATLGLSWPKGAGKSSPGGGYPVRGGLNDKISLLRGDITTLEVDAIVNAANSSLMGGGEVMDGAIHSGAGIFLKKECSLLNGCDTGDAKITCGYKLPAKYVIHTVGPMGEKPDQLKMIDDGDDDDDDYDDDDDDDEEDDDGDGDDDNDVIHTVGPMGEKPDQLKSAYMRCLELVRQHHLTSLAFPCISTGIYGYPPQAAAQVALETVRTWLETEGYADKVQRIIFCVFLKKDLEIYEELLPVYFPLHARPGKARAGSTDDAGSPDPQSLVAGGRVTEASQGSRKAEAREGSRKAEAREGSRKVEGGRVAEASEGSWKAEASEGSRKAEGGRVTEASKGSRKAEGGQVAEASEGSRKAEGGRVVEVAEGRVGEGRVGEGGGEVTESHAGHEDNASSRVTQGSTAASAEDGGQTGSSDGQGAVEGGARGGEEDREAGKSHKRKNKGEGKDSSQDGSEGRRLPKL
ncbi:hypothetical protein ACOMHN_035242 [Nucella lapillus]